MIGLDIVNNDKMKDLDRGDCADCLIAGCAGALFFTRANTARDAILNFFRTKEAALNSVKLRDYRTGRKHGAFEMTVRGRILHLPAYGEVLKLEDQLELI